MRAYDALKAIHILLVIVWLGTDIGTFASFNRLLDTKLAVPTRLSMSRLSDLLDQGPRSALVLLLMLGLSLSHMGAFGFGGDAGAALAWAAAGIGVVWFVGVWMQFWVAHAPPGAVRPAWASAFVTRFKVVDLWWRVGVAGALVIAGVTSLAASGSGGIISADWLAWKVLLFALIVADGVVIRLLLPKLGSVIVAIATGGSTPEREKELAQRAVPLKACGIVIWVLLIMMSAIAVMKPGS
jgi:type IV secretory pathway TrbD component